MSDKNQFSIKFILIFISILFGCSSSKSIYSFDSILSSEIVKSSNTDLLFQLPQNWFVAENQNSNFDIWLIKNDYSSTIKFKILSITDNSNNNLLNINEQKLASIEMEIIKNHIGKNFKGFFNIENFEISGKNFSAFEFIDQNSNPTRVLIFKYHDKFYEVIASTKIISEQKSLYDLQNSILKSIN